MFVWVRKIAVFLAAIALAMAPQIALAQETESTPAEAFLVTPLSFQKEIDLDFGQIIASNTNGTVVMDSAGTVTTTGGIVHINGTQQPARFWGYGSFNQRVLINVTANSYTLTEPVSGETIIMDQILIGSQPPINITTNPRRFRIANPDGFFSFTIAGRLQVSAGQAPGIYSGEFTVTLEYE
ncbi:MAG: DUF4402 domain-containing protein [Pseudomonadota bacterium]